MRRRVTFAAITMASLFVLPLSAQHGGSCACGKSGTGNPVAWQVELPDGSDLLKSAQTEFNKWTAHANVISRADAGNLVWAKNNGANELVFLSAADTLSQYGFAIDSDVFGITWISPLASFGTPAFDACPVPQGTTCATFSETDVIINRDFIRGWTTASPPDFDDDSGPAYFGATALHEIGHALGLHHNFTNISTMNYYEDFAGRYLSMADATALRANYPTQAKAVMDLAAYPFRHTGAAGYGAARVAHVSPHLAHRGDTITLYDFSVENASTFGFPTSTVALTIYLSTNANITDRDYVLGTLTFPSFPVNSYWDSTGWGFVVPDTISSGTYYVGARITNNGGEESLSYNNDWVLDATEQVTIVNDIEPYVTITAPTAAATYATSVGTVNLAGTATPRFPFGDRNYAEVTEVTCRSEVLPNIESPFFPGTLVYSDAFATATGTTNWACSLPLAPGDNEITVLGTYGRYHVGADTMVVNYTPTCVYSLSLLSASFPYAATEFGFYRIAGSPHICAGSWSVTSDADWIVLKGPASGTGPLDQRFQYSITKNLGPARTGHIVTSWGEVFTVNQAAYPPTHIAIIVGDGQATSINSAFRDVVGVSVWDGDNRPKKDVPVMFTIVPGSTGASGGFASPPPLTTDADGYALAPVVARDTIGDFTILVRVEGVDSPAVIHLTCYIEEGSGTPVNVTATATSTTSVLVTWTGAPTLTSYEVSRSTNGTTFPITFITMANSYLDTGLAPNTAYLYRVRALSPGASPYSSRDLATTILFTDPTLTRGASVVKAAHFAELRTAVNAVRRLAGLPDFAFSGATLSSGTIIRASHIAELRAALDAARAVLTLPRIVYANTITPHISSISAADVTELRQATK